MNIKVKPEIKLGPCIHIKNIVHLLLSKRLIYLKTLFSKTKFILRLVNLNLTKTCVRKFQVITRILKAIIHLINILTNRTTN